MSNTIHKTEYIHQLLRFIESNISADLDTELLSRFNYVSLPKLYRDFYNLTGHSVKEYIRKRRLSNALALIKTSDMELTDIAFHCGYSSYLTLWRAIKQMLGLTPSDYKNGTTYYFFPPFKGEPIQPVIVANEIIAQTLCLLYYDSKFTDIENTAVNTFLQVFPNYNGRIFGRNGKQDGSKFCYELYLTDIETDYNKLKQYNFITAKIIPCHAAVFATSTVVNNELKINAAWNYLYSEWLQNSMYECTDNPYFEEYILKKAKPIKLKLYLPIQKRKEDTKIILIKNPELRFIIAKAKGFDAEKTATGIVVDYITINYPHIVQSINDLFLQKDINSHICGVQVNSKLQLVKNENITNFKTEHNNYLVLKSNVMGDYDRYADMLYSFALDNNMDTDKKGIFAVYNTQKGSNNVSIKMYCPVKIVIK